jgi:hypothetical protein
MLQYAIDTQLGLVVVSAAGAVDAAQLLALRQQIKVDADYDSKLSALVDLSGASSLDFTAAELRQLAGSTMTAPSARQAIVVGTDLGFGLGRMFETFSAVGGHSENVQVFRSVAEARAWLLADRAP